MSSSGDLNKGVSTSTYVVHDSKKKAELVRLVLQSSMITTAMGGVLAEQVDASSFRRVLDVACGTGGWILEAAQTYSEMNLVGIDISTLMIEYARNQTKTQGLEGRAEFHVMDALKKLEFPDDSFDLVNLRFGMSFVRTWDWNNLLFEMQRVVRPGGVIRLTECELSTQGTSAALTQNYEIGMRAFYQAGHLFTQESTGLTSHLPGLLANHWCEDVQSKTYPLVFRAGTPEGESFKEDMKYTFQTTRPFLQKWGGVPENYDALYRQSRKDMEQPDFFVVWPHITVWGRKPLAKA